MTASMFRELWNLVPEAGVLVDTARYSQQWYRKPNKKDVIICSDVVML
jgi:hypothetical protein